jgi:hypothetical protein
LSLFTIVLDGIDLLLPSSAGIVLVIVFSLFFVLFVHYVCVNIHPVIRIYVCCKNLYAHRSPQESVVGDSAGQTVECEPPVFDLLLLLNWVRPLGLSTNIYTEIFQSWKSYSIVSCGRIVVITSASVASENWSQGRCEGKRLCPGAVAG